MLGSAKRARRDQRRAIAGEASNAVDAGGLNGLSESYGRQDGGVPYASIMVKIRLYRD
jgi:hypothetical protein